MDGQNYSVAMGLHIMRTLEDQICDIWRVGLSRLPIMDDQHYGVPILQHIMWMNPNVEGSKL